MADGTQLWNKNKKDKIYPISDASVITSTAANPDIVSTVHKDLLDIFKQLSDITGDKEAVDNIDFEIRYKRSKSKLLDNVKADTGWNPDFINPTSDNPYTWKRTTITYKGGTPKVVYEIVASNNAELTQVIYIALPDTTYPTIVYPTKAGKEDLTAFDKDLPKVGEISWSEVPVPITASLPNAYMATRKKVDGAWLKFSTPALYGKWAFDSILEIRYQVTALNSAPFLRKEEVIPDSSDEQVGKEWLITNTASSGYLWMITATSVGGLLQKNNGIIWQGPNLISKL